MIPLWSQSPGHSCATVGSGTVSANTVMSRKSRHQRSTDRFMPSRSGAEADEHPAPGLGGSEAFFVIVVEYIVDTGEDTQPSTEKLCQLYVEHAETGVTNVRSELFDLIRAVESFDPQQHVEWHPYLPDPIETVVRLVLDLAQLPAAVPCLRVEIGIVH